MITFNKQTGPTVVQFSVAEKDAMTRLITGAESYAMLTDACKQGYVPTIRIDYDLDTDIEVTAKLRLRQVLEADGFRVFPAAKK